jgi:outer membrane receptor protein involved in Fe transport
MNAVRSIVVPVSIAGAALLMFAGAAFTQVPLAASLDIDTPRIDELVVTARKQPETELTVPLSVSAFTADTIQGLGLFSLGDVARFTPGFSFDSATGRQPSSYRPNIRGLTTIRNGIANTSSAATFIDGVYVGGSAQTSALYNLERVEVVRGPQSVLYGRGTYAGAINYVTRRPGENFEGQVTVTGAEYDTLAVTAWAGGPVVDDKLSFYIAGGHREYGGEYVNTVTGEKVGGEQSDDITGKLYWYPSAALEISLQLATESSDDEHYATWLQPRGLNNCCFRTPAAPRAREYYVGEAVPEQQVTLATDLLDAAGGAGSRLDRHRAVLDIGWQSDSGYAIRSLTGYIDDELERGFDDSYAAYDPLPMLPGFFTKYEELEQSDFSQELRLSSPVDQVVSWSLGAYYYEGEFNDVVSERVYRDASNAIIVAPSFSPLTREEISNRAIFGGVNWSITDAWFTALELRWARDEITVTNRSNDAAEVAEPAFENSFDNVTPRFTLGYLAEGRSNYYLSIAKGIKPGTFNPTVPDESYRTVDEETVWSYELGAKNQWTDRLATTAAVYYMDVEDQQLTQIVEYCGPGSTPDNCIPASTSLIENIGESAIWGIELGLRALATERLNIDVTYAYTDAEYREHISVDEADLRGSDGSAAQTQALGDVSGNSLPRVPEHMASLIATYEQPVRAELSWYVIGDCSYESSKFAQEHNLIETGNRQLAGLRTGLRNERWDLSLWVTNLFDDETPVDITRYFDTRSGTLPGYPQNGPRVSSSPRAFALSLPQGRQAGATLRFSF